MSNHAPTGPGRVTTSNVVPVGGVRAVMSNYDIDVDTPKPEHLVFLNSRVIPVLLGHRARIWLQGSASHTGTAAHNMALSQRRAENVAQYLNSRGVPTSQMQIEWVGEGLAANGIPENADDRAVSLLAAPLLAPPRPTPPTPAPTPRTTPTNTLFKIRLLGGLSGGESAPRAARSRSGTSPRAGRSAPCACRRAIRSRSRFRPTENGWPSA